MHLLAESFIALSIALSILQVDGDRIVFTNSLVYARNMTSPVKYFSEVVLTHSCSYTMEAYDNVINYKVYSNNYTFEAENKDAATFDVK